MFKRTARKTRNFFMLIKVYWSRTTTYLALVNASMILFLTLSKLKELGYIAFNIDKFFLPLIIGGVIGLIIIGYIETAWVKANQEEHSINFNLTPEFVNMKMKIDEMYDDFKKKKELKGGLKIK